jgi:hypothetical protein
MALAAVRKIGISLPVLRSFRWTKPGVAEAQVVQEGVIEGDAQPKEFPALPMAMEREAYREEWRGGVGTRTWIYRAGKEMPANKNDPNMEKPSEVWSCDVVLQEKPLTSHPNILTIMDVYGGVQKSGGVEFPPRLANSDINPLYMVDTYLSPTVQVTLEEVKSGTAVSVESLRDLGFIDTAPTSGFPFLNQLAGQWLLVDHMVRKEGKDTSEKRSWKWGGPGGWVKPVYEKGHWG